MFPSPFSYARPSSLPEALAILAEYRDDAKVLAGGQSLIPLLKLRLAAPGAIVDIGGLESLNHTRVDADHLVVGALTRYCDLERSDLVRRECPVLGHVASLVGDPQVRHRGTIGGSLAHADPASDLPALLLALDGSVRLTSGRGSRDVPAQDFFQGFLTTAMADDEIVTEVRIPRGCRSWRYEKFTRRAQEWAVLGVVVVRDDQTGQVRVGLVNAGSTPLRAHTVEAALAGGADAATAARQVAEDMHPSADVAASAEYRRHLAVTLLERILHELDVAA
ncbi:MAG TPA: xanthine dehydrogenase family protein subunit M [Mycobacteriales bacterium]